MRAFIITILTCSVSMSSLAIIYMAASPLLSRWYSVKWRYYAWLVIVVGLIIPFRPQFGVAVVTVDAPAETIPLVQVRNTLIAGITTGNIPAYTPVSSGLFSGITLWQALFMLWVGGAVSFFIYHFVKHYRFTRLTTRWSKIIDSEEILSVLRELKDEMGISQPIGLKFCSMVGTPLITGFVRPCILLPKTDFSSDEMRLILRHELVHHKRKDLWYKSLVLIATAIHWFNPVIHRMNRTINIQCELSCDDEVIRHTNVNTRQHYSEIILRVAKVQSKPNTVLSTYFFGGNKDMKKRITSIMDTGKKRMGTAIFCVALILTLGTAIVFAVNTGTIGGKSAPDQDLFQTGDTIAIQVIADSVTDLSSYEFALGYDADALQIKNILSGIEIMWAGAIEVETGIMSVSSIRRGDEDGYPLEGDISGENMLLCEFVAEVMRDGPAEGLSIQDDFVSNSAREPMENPPGLAIRVVPLSSEQVLEYAGQDTNLFEPPAEGEILYSEGPFKPELREPGYMRGDYDGKLQLQAEELTVATGESFQVEVSSNEPRSCLFTDILFWFDPEVLTYEGFEGDAQLQPSSQLLDAETGIVSIGFKTKEEFSSLADRFGQFQFKVREDADLSGTQSALVIVADYFMVGEDTFSILSQNGEIAVTIR